MVVNQTDEFLGGGGPTPESESRSNFHGRLASKSQKKTSHDHHNVKICQYSNKNPMMIHINHINIYHMPTWKMYEFSLT